MNSDHFLALLERAGKKIGELVNVLENSFLVFVT